MKRSTFPFALLFSVVLAHAPAQPPSALQDPFLDNFVGDWRVERKRPNGSVSENAMHAEWALKHHFVELHYGHGEASPQYEAKVFMGYNDSKQSYVCYWMDIFGGRYSVVGHGKIDNDKHTVEFRFVMT